MGEFAYQERSPGIYPAVFKLIEDFEATDQATGEVKPFWRWVFQDIDDDTTAGEVDTITSRHYRARSNGLKLFTGLLGRAPGPGDDPEKLYGTTVNVVYGPNQNGRLTITDVLPYKAPKA